MEKRNIVMCIILSFLTCGIYLYYWIYQLNKDMNYFAGEDDDTSGLLIIYIIITCGIYLFYWLYKKGQQMDSVREGTNNSLIFTLLGVFGLSIIPLAIMQDTINKTLDE